MAGRAGSLEAVLGEVVFVKWLAGPVSSLGCGAVKGSRRYLLACE